MQEHTIQTCVYSGLRVPFCFLDMALPANRALMIWYDKGNQATSGLPSSASIESRHLLHDEQEPCDEARLAPG
jgi:hypothetical protein